MNLNKKLHKNIWGRGAVTRLIQQAHILTRGNGTEIIDVLFDEGQIVKTVEHIDPASAQEVISAENCVLLSGLIDVHVHLREPGCAHKGTVANGTAAAARGDFTTIVTMPDVIPYPGSAETMKIYLTKIGQNSRVHVTPYACITKARASQKPSDMERLSATGIHVFNDDGVGMTTAGMVKAAMQKCHEVDGIIVAHTEDMSHRRPSTCMHGDIHNKQLGLTRIPSACEYAQSQRDLALVRETGCRYHVCHMNAQESVESLRRIKKKGLDVSGEIMTHHLLLNEMAVENANHKMSPPLRSEEGHQALIQGLLDGTIDVIADDRAPHNEEEKNRGMEKAPFNIVILGTAFPLLYTRFVKEEGIFMLKQLMYWMSETSTKRFQVGRRRKLKGGNVSDFVLMSLDSVRKIEKQRFYSMGKNIPFDGIVCSGFAVKIFVDGTCVYDNKEGLLR